jgi:divalent metal cation (Fe/Co/Zn/Cd) transporter
MTAATSSDATNRAQLVGRGIALEGFTIGWNVLEAGLAVGSGIVARSVALTGFGVDSIIEVIAAVALFRRLRTEARGGGAADERSAMRVVALAFFALSAYVIVDSLWTLGTRRAAEGNFIGVAVAALALFVMPVLARAKLRVGEAIGSAALVADAKCTLACAWLSAAVLAGVALNAALGWWWADPLAALAMVPFLVREGREALEKSRGQATTCSCHGGCEETGS